MGRGARQNETVVVRALCIGPEGTLLLRRAAGDRFGGQWELPGGKRDPGERAPAALKREVAEEAQVRFTARPRRVGGLRRRRTPTGRRISEMVYEVPVTGTPQLSDEHDAVMWLRSGIAAPENLTDAARDALRDRHAS